MTRAISLASGMSYAETQDKLYLTAQLLDCDRLCVCCYRHLLDYIFSYPRLDSTNMTVNDVCHRYPHGTLLVRVNGHLTTIIDGVIYDTWDCGNELVDIIWLAKY